MLKEMVFALGLRSDGFDRGMASATAQMRKLGAVRLEELRRQMAQLTADGQVLDRQKFKTLQEEYKSLQQTMNATDRAQKGLTREVSGFSRIRLDGLLSSLGTAAKWTGIGSVISGVAGMIGSAFGAAKGLTSGLADNASMEQVETFFTSLLGNVDRARGVIGELRKEADISPFDTKDVIEAGKSLITAAGNDRARMMELVRLAERLAVLNPEEGLKGAAFALKEALSGDFVSLKERFNISKTEIDALKRQGLGGDEIVDQVLKKMNITQETVNRLGTTMEGRISTIRAFVSDLLSRVTAGVFGNLSGLLAGVAGWIETNGTRARDIASGIGIILGNGLQRAIEWAKELVSTTGNLFVMVSAWGTAIWNWIQGLPERIAQAFQSGRLVQVVAAMIGAALQIAWEAAKALGGLIWAGVEAGIPALKALIGKVLVDALRGALGERVSGMLGLGDASKLLEREASLRGSEFTGMTSRFMESFATNTSEIMQNAGSVIGDFVGNDLGGNQVREQAQRQIKDGRQTPSWFNRVEVVGAHQRIAQEGAAAAAEAAAPRVQQQQQQANLQLDQAAENYNARVERRRARNLKREQEEQMQRAREQRMQRMQRTRVPVIHLSAAQVYNPIMQMG